MLFCLAQVDGKPIDFLLQEMMFGHGILPATFYRLKKWSVEAVALEYKLQMSASILAQKLLRRYTLAISFVFWVIYCRC